MNILVFCSAQDVPEKYGKDAKELGTLIAQGGHTLVWGGSHYGLMKIVADAVQAAGGKTIGVTLELFAENARKNADEMAIAKTPSERKRMMLERADAVVVLPGGIGTLDEATEALALKRFNYHAKPVIFLDSDGFYEGFRMQWKRMEADGFFTTSTETNMLIESDLVRFVSTPQEVMEHLA